MKQILTNAVVLRRINYGEADRIITFLTSDQGKLTVIAKGVRRAKSKLAGSIELFGTSQITYMPGRGEMSTLISARLINNYSNIVKDFKRTQFGYEILKLINKNLEIIGDESIFQLLDSTLGYLNESSISLELTKFWFSIQFLLLMGHSPNLNVDSNDIKNYIFDIDKMKFLPEENGSYNKNHIKVVRLSIGNTPEQLAKIRGIDNILEKILNLSQTMLVSSGFNPL